jgi:hypothetical protein
MNIDSSIKVDPNMPRSLRLEQSEEEIRELRRKIDHLENLIHNILGIDQPMEAKR